METPLQVVILAAGLGTRMKSKTAKVLHRAGGAALIEHAVDTTLELAPPERIFVVVGYQAERVRELVEGRGVRFVRQDEQKGTGHALMTCRDAVGTGEGLLLVLYGDSPLLKAETLRRLVDAHCRSSAAATVITTTPDDPAGYGRVVRDEAGAIAAIVEQKAATAEQLTIGEINSGIYCFRNDLLWKYIAELRAGGAAAECYLTDIVEIFRRAGHAVAAMRHEDFRDLQGINTRVELAAADRIFRERAVRRWMLEGVTVEKPETVTIDPRVRIGADTVIEPFAQILGQTVIGEDCTIGACSIIRDSELADGVVVAPFTIIVGSRLDTGAQAGPYARLRMENHLEAGARVGNFVELKRARLGAGARSMHLTYLGDCSIGRDTNIGAGTITCNYDGFKKHATVIGEGAFVGSNTILVAPVEVGDRSYVAAGSVITESVPSEALALGRARQVNKPGWIKKRFGTEP